VVGIRRNIAAANEYLGAGGNAPGIRRQTVRDAHEAARASAQARAAVFRPPSSGMRSSTLEIEEGAILEIDVEIRSQRH